jgi:hypothetical protein
LPSPLEHTKRTGSEQKMMALQDSSAFSLSQSASINSFQHILHGQVKKGDTKREHLQILFIYLVHTAGLQFVTGSNPNVGKRFFEGGMQLYFPKRLALIL